MNTMMRGIAGLMLAGAATVSSTLAQEKIKEKDAPYLTPSRESIVSSSLCQQSREHSSEIDPKNRRPGVVHRRIVDPPTLESDLTGLMAISDEVVLAGIATRDANAIAPSGEDAIHSFQVKVLHAWKGDLKVGQTIVFSVPTAMLNCAINGPDLGSPAFETRSDDERWGLGGGEPEGPFVLFLRHAQGPERELTPDLRLAGGDGIQGMFWIDYYVIKADASPGETIPTYLAAWVFADHPGVSSPSKLGAANARTQLSMAARLKLTRPCNGVLDGSVEECLAYLTTGRDWIGVQHGSDPLFKKYEGMETGKFFEEVDSAARSLGFTTLLLEGQ
jgi:hypothetical protein